MERVVGADPRGPLILFYNSFFGRYPDLGRFRFTVPCRLTIDQHRLKEADVVVFHLPDSRSIRDARKYPGQLWVGWTLESPAHTPVLANERFARLLDIRMSYERTADIWEPYLPKWPVWQAALSKPVPPKTERRSTVFFQSATIDACGRNAYAAELMRYLKVDSFGRFLNNRTLPVDDGAATKLATIGGYRFCLGFENTIAPDYVTEKFYQPLLAGTIPVYRGAPNVDDFAPGDRCFVDANRFPDPRGLAAYLDNLVHDEAAYRAYFDWRQKPLRPAFVKQLEASATDPISRLAELVTARLAERRRAPPGSKVHTPFGWRSYLRTKIRRSRGRLD